MYIISGRPAAACAERVFNSGMLLIDHRNYSTLFHHSRTISMEKGIIKEKHNRLKFGAQKQSITGQRNSIIFLWCARIYNNMVCFSQVP